ncbi:MAG: D-glycero-beta-D-manno-heptose 1,7-bisphosphate 7-phosphatase [Motiliproteus sp.]
MDGGSGDVQGRCQFPTTTAYLRPCRQCTCRKLLLRFRHFPHPCGSAHPVPDGISALPTSVWVVCHESHGWRQWLSQALLHVQTMNKLIILDRDGVINQDSDAYVKNAAEWIPLPGSAEAIARLCKAGYRVAVATNQSGLGRGYFTQVELDAMHAKMSAVIAAAGGRLDGIFFCPHSPDQGCDCRKPLPGLIHQIEAALVVSAQGAIMIGDSLRDLEAGQSAGCIPILVKTGKGLRTLSKGKGLEGVAVFDDLAAVVDHLLDGQR